VKSLNPDLVRLSSAIALLQTVPENNFRLTRGTLSGENRTDRKTVASPLAWLIRHADFTHPDYALTKDGTVAQRYVQERFNLLAWRQYAKALFKLTNGRADALFCPRGCCLTDDELLGTHPEQVSDKELFMRRARAYLQGISAALVA
jgi:hypothetical protein